MRYFLQTVLSVALFLTVCSGYGQGRPPAIVINEVHNEIDQNDEYSELIVVKDSLDLRGWYFGDNNSGTKSWQAKIQFTQNQLWQNLRAGTYIIIDHVDVSASCHVTQDIDKSDGYIRVCSKNPTYFNGGDASTLDISGSGDFLQIVNPIDTQVHALGFDDQPGTSVRNAQCTNCVYASPNWSDINNTHTGTPAYGNFTFLETQLLPATSLVMRATSAQQYVGSLTQGNLYPDTTTRRVPIGISSGSAGFGNDTANAKFIRSLRRPKWRPDSGCVVFLPNNGGVSINITPPSNVSFDVNPLGYCIVGYPADPGAAPLPPQDGQQYARGQALYQNNPLYGTVLFWDKLIVNRSQLTLPVADTIYRYFRVFLFRYIQTASIIKPDRGPAYNPNPLSRSAPSPTLPAIIGPGTLCYGDTAGYRVPLGPNPIAISWSAQNDSIQIIPIAGRPDSIRVFMRTQLPQPQFALGVAGVQQGLCPSAPTVKNIKLGRPNPFTLTADSIVDSASTAHLTINGDHLSDITYKPAGTLTQVDSAHFTFKAIAPATYIFMRGLRGSSGCFFSDTVTILTRHVVIPPTVDLRVPNVISLNSTLPRNRTFAVDGATVDNLVIYNRWGAKVLSSSPYNNDWAGDPATYFITANLTLQDGSKQTYKGWLEVVK